MYEDEIDGEDPTVRRQISLDPTLSLLTSDEVEKIKGKTIITRKERDVFAKMLVYAKDWGIPELHDFVIEKMYLAPSVDGQSREEVVTIMAGRPLKPSKRSLIDKVLRKERS